MHVLHTNRDRDTKRLINDAWSSQLNLHLIHIVNPLSNEKKKNQNQIGAGDRTGEHAQRERTSDIRRLIIQPEEKYCDWGSYYWNRRRDWRAWGRNISVKYANHWTENGIRWARIRYGVIAHNRDIWLLLLGFNMYTQDDLDDARNKLVLIQDSISDTDAKLMAALWRRRVCSWVDRWDWWGSISREILRIMVHDYVTKPLWKISKTRGAFLV